MADPGGTDLPCEAESPFHSSARADVILRSSDNVDFYVMKAFLSFSSVVFESMFSLPASPTSKDQIYKGNLPVIVMSEESKHIRPLLLFCYPLGMVLELETGSFEDTLATVSAAEKYGMDAVEQQLRQKIIASSEMTQNPLRVFAIAFHRGWEDVGRAAARSTLAIPIKDLPYSQDLVFLSGVEAYRLSEYRYQCAKAIRTWVKDRKPPPHSVGVFYTVKFYRGTLLQNSTHPRDFCWWNANRDGSLELSGHKCTTKPESSDNENICKEKRATFILPGGPNVINIRGRLWWTTYFVSLLGELEVCPTGRTVLNDTLSNQAIKTAAMCTICGPQVHRDMENFKKLFAQVVDDVVSAVPLDINV